MHSITNTSFDAEISDEASQTDTKNDEDCLPTTKAANEVEDDRGFNTTNENTCSSKNSKSQSDEDVDNDDSVSSNIRNSDESRENSEVKSDSGTQTESTDDPDAEECSGESEVSEMSLCPICDTVLSSQHDFTLHIRSHNNDGEDLPAEVLKTFTCKFCHKALSSSSLLDRHVLVVHPRERPFKCLICGDGFTTNGNMHRHMRTHNSEVSKSEKTNKYEIVGSTSSGDSFNNKSTVNLPQSGNNIDMKRRVGNHTPSQTKTKSSGSTALSFQSPNGNKRKLPELIPSDATGTDDCASKRRIKAFQNSHPDTLECSSQQSVHCPVCNREDFISLNILETHLEEIHPEYQIRCHDCDQTFKNTRALNLHRHMAQHATSVDFSCKKFPHIDVAISEEKLHKQSSVIKYQCNKCGYAFPSAPAINIHHGQCNENQGGHICNSDTPTDLSNNRRTSVKERSLESEEKLEEHKCEDFFIALGLQKKSVPSSPSYSFQHNHPRREDVYSSTLNVERNEIGEGNRESGKDITDIQSIISVASAGGLIQDLSKSPPQDNAMTAVCGVRCDSVADEEEQQDCFAAEFRHMKLKGEFPCRLCTAVFPNLRALKGHNRSHITGSVGIFRCNMCPYTNSAKTSLVRHMRSHNGDRPYDCALCNYAFTTKANRERHVRNRHFKLSKRNVKKSIICHPPQDKTNNPDLQAKLQAQGDVERSSVFNNQHSSSLKDVNTLECSLGYRHSLDERKSNCSLDNKLMTVKYEHEDEDTDEENKLVIDEEKDIEEEATDRRQSREETRDKFSDGNSREGAISSAKDVDLASVLRLVDNATTHTQAFQRYFRDARDGEVALAGSGEDEEDLFTGSNNEGNNLGSNENT
jgi:hypothetical protein